MQWWCLFAVCAFVCDTGHHQIRNPQTQKTKHSRTPKVSVCCIQSLSVEAKNPQMSVKTLGFRLAQPGTDRQKLIFQIGNHRCDGVFDERDLHKTIGGQGQRQ